MKGTVKIGDREIPMMANGATNIYYRQLTKKDLLAFFTSQKKNADNADGIEALMPLAYVMAMQAEGRTTFSMDDYMAWLAEFEPLEIEMALDAVMNLYTNNKVSTATPKKNNAR